MQTQQVQDQWPQYEENDPPLDLTRENAAFERERPRLVREHLGKIALLHGDEVAGVFDNVNDALLEGYRRFGHARLIFRPITERDEPEWISNVDINHTCVRRID